MAGIFTELGNCFRRVPWDLSRPIVEKKAGLQSEADFLFRVSAGYSGPGISLGLDLKFIILRQKTPDFKQGM